MKTVHLEISGKVQGVSFRARANEVAKKLHLSGWIKNKEDDKVEAIVTGEDESVKEFIGWCQQGPDTAKVENVLVTNKEIKHFPSFRVIR